MTSDPHAPLEPLLMDYPSFFFKCIAVTVNSAERREIAFVKINNISFRFKLAKLKGRQLCV